jgi:uncharacterized protein with FMN-binding domain
MNIPSKKVLVVLLCICVALVIAVAGVIACANRVMRQIETVHSSMPAIDLSTVPDGVYHGAFGSLPVYVSLEVTMKDHRIAGISIKNQICGKNYDARETVLRIVRSQAARVDAVAGATISSKCIMIAVYKALYPAAHGSER